MPRWLNTAWQRLQARGITAAAALLLALWVGLILFAWFASRATGQTWVTCHFRRFTGYPCATCGGTRAAMKLAHGEVAAAVTLNPLATLLIVAAPLLLAWWVLVPPSTRPGRVSPRVQLALLLIAIFANWAYVLWRFGRGEL